MKSNEKDDKRLAGILAMLREDEKRKEGDDSQGAPRPAPASDDQREPMIEDEEFVEERLTDRGKNPDEGEDVGEPYHTESEQYDEKGRHEGRGKLFGHSVSSKLNVALALLKKKGRQ